MDDAGDAPSSHEPRAPESSSPEAHADPVAAEALAQRWQSRLASAAQAAMRAGRLSIPSRGRWARTVSRVCLGAHSSRAS